MENKERHIDKILLSKTFEQLTAEEHILVKKEIPTEAEYNDLREMLIAAEASISGIEEIEPKSSTKTFLMNEFVRVHTALQPSKGGLGFLFPSDKAFYQKPGYQLLAIAAVLVLIFTIYPKLTGGITNNDDLAQHNVEKEVKKIDVLNTEESASSNQENTEEMVFLDNEANLAEEKADLTQPETENNLIGKLKQEQPASFASEGSTVVISELANVSTFEAEDAMMPSPVTDKDISLDLAVAEEEIADESTNAIIAGNNNYKASDDNNSEIDNSSGYVFSQTDDSDIKESESLEKTELSGSVNTVARAVESKKSVSVTVKKSKSLAENSELIDLFYTAM